jgi:hypothetical protein
MLGSRRLIGSVVSLALFGAVAMMAAPAMVGAKPKPPKCGKGFHYDKHKKKCVKNKKPKPHGGISCGNLIEQGVVWRKDITAHGTIHCDYARTIARNFRCDDVACRTGRTGSGGVLSSSCTGGAKGDRGSYQPIACRISGGEVDFGRLVY